MRPDGPRRSDLEAQSTFYERPVSEYIPAHRHARCYNLHIINITCAPSDEFGLGDKLLRACGLRSVASVALLVLLIGLAISNVLMQRLSADYEGRARYILVPDIVIHRQSSKPVLTVSPPGLTKDTEFLQRSALQASSAPPGSRNIRSAFDPASPQPVSAEDLAVIPPSFSKQPTPTSLGQSMARWDMRDEAAPGIMVQSPNAAPSSGKTSTSAPAKKTVRHAKVTSKKKGSPAEAFFRSIRRLLMPPNGDKPQKKARSATARSSSD